MRSLFVFFLSVVLLACLISFISCSRDEDVTMDVSINDDEDEYVTMDLTINDIEIFISRDYYQVVPYIMIVLVHGSVTNSCEYPYKTKHHWQDNNTVIIEIKTKRVIDDSFDCSTNVAAFQIPIYIGIFAHSAMFEYEKHEEGKYEVIVNGKYEVIVNGVKKEFYVDSVFPWR